MKKTAIAFLFSFCFLLISCETTPEPVSAPPAVRQEEPIVEPPVVPQVEAVPQTQKTMLILPEGTSIRNTARGKVLETTPKIIFKMTETNMPASAPKAFSQVIAFLQSNPNVKIVLEAHTSNMGIAYPYNYNLSVARAIHGKEYLVKEGMDSIRIIESPLGEALPEYPTQNALRRYEFVIVENDADMAVYNDFISTIDVRKEYSYSDNNNSLTNTESNNQ